MAAKVYPAYESEIQSGRTVSSSVDFCRLRWYLRGPISKSIHVLQDATDAKSPQDPYQTETVTHSICASSLTEPPIASISISIYELDFYESDWKDFHERHHDPKERTNLIRDSVGILRCSCGHVRPLPGPTLFIQAEPGQFLTIGKYIDVVHPWLTRLEGHIRVAHNVWSDWPLEPKYEIWLGSASIKTLSTRNGHGGNAQWEEMEWERIAKYARKTLQTQLAGEAPHGTSTLWVVDDQSSTQQAEL